MSGFYEKCKPVKNKKLYDEYLLEHDYCECCGRPGGVAACDGGVPNSRHHIVKFRRSDERTNLLVLCNRCHLLAEGHRVREGDIVLTRLSLGICLTIKQTRSPDEFNPERLAELYGGGLPDLEPIPEFFKESWRKWQG